MSFFGFLSAPISVPKVLDTSPCLDHLMEYEDCVIDVQSDKKRLLMPSWPTLYPGLTDGKTNELLDTRSHDMAFKNGQEHDLATDRKALTARQKQLLYECEEERLVFKACARDLLKLRRTAKMTSWDTAEAANMGLN